MPSVKHNSTLDKIIDLISLLLDITCSKTYLFTKKLPLYPVLSPLLCRLQFVVCMVQLHGDKTLSITGTLSTLFFVWSANMFCKAENVYTKTFAFVLHVLTSSVGVLVSPSEFLVVAGLIAEVL